jgi:hypothetical protein
MGNSSPSTSTVETIGGILSRFRWVDPRMGWVQRQLSPAADMSWHTLWAAMGQQRTNAPQQRAPAATPKWSVPMHPRPNTVHLTIYKP